MSLDLIGWYTTGVEQPTASDLAVHLQMSVWNESAILLKLDPTISSPDKASPILDPEWIVPAFPGALAHLRVGVGHGDCGGRVS
jgi:hypothetical protein